jgi:hypothetical protein
MGHSHSNDLQLRDLSPEDYNLFLDEEYTVKRSDGTIQSGWKIRDGAHYCMNSDVVAAHHRQASVTHEPDNVNAYKFFMIYENCDNSCSGGSHNAPCGHVCGWRPCYPGKRNFWPTRCEVQEDKAAWWGWVDGCIAYLETKSQSTTNA